jgi:hypothetical protein
LKPRKLPETTPRPLPAGAPRAIRESGVRAALRDRRRRRFEEAGMQSLVRALATQMPPPVRGR